MSYFFFWCLFEVWWLQGRSGLEKDKAPCTSIQHLTGFLFLYSRDYPGFLCGDESPARVRGQRAPRAFSSVWPTGRIGQSSGTVHVKVAWLCVVVACEYSFWVLLRVLRIRLRFCVFKVCHKGSCFLPVSLFSLFVLLVISFINTEEAIHNKIWNKLSGVKTIFRNFLFFFSVFFFFFLLNLFETESHYTVQTAIEPTLQPRVILNLQCSLPYFPKY